MTTSTKTRRPTKTPEQRRAEAAELQARLTSQVETLTTSEGWAKFLEFAGRFRTYSVNNALLILAQRPDSTHVAGFRQWQNLGRQVRRGETGIRIFGYSKKRITVEDEAGEEAERVVSRFPVLTVFDITQTDPIPDFGQPEDHVDLLVGDDPNRITDHTAKWLEDRGWTFSRQHISSAANGYTDPLGRAVVVDSALGPAAAAKTSLHEAAHVVLHATDETAFGAYRNHRGRGETEAESVAYVLGGLLGLDTSAYSVGYIAGWSGGDLELVRETADNVLSAVAAIATAFPDLR